MVCVISNTGMKLMPTSEYRARRLLKNNKATIRKHRPFTIKLTHRSNGDTQPIEYKCDTGYQNIGISICSKKHEYISEERTLLKNEVERHNDQRKYRRARRNRKTRYRKARWQNRRNNLMCKDGFAPSIRNKRDIHINLFKMYYEVIPITSAVFEMGQFDTQLLKAIEEGKSLPEGTDYQQGEAYGYATLREAVFSRDNYKCVCCGKSAIKDKIILRIHHLGYLKGDRTNKMSNLASVCTNCHTSKNHKEGGKLYGLKTKLKSFKGATFMTMVRWDMWNRLNNEFSDINFSMTYGAKTKQTRRSLHITKSHANDAYCMGEVHPKHRTKTLHYQKCRRNNRILSKFYDAKYIDIRDGSKKSGQQLSCNRTNRSEPRNSSKNERIYRGNKVSKGRVSVRKQHYQYRPGDIVLFEGNKYQVIGVVNKGNYLRLLNHSKDVKVTKVTSLKHCNAWAIQNAV